MKADKSIHWWSSPRTLLRAILMLDDTAHSIALGTAVGMFIGMTPTVGIQMILVVVFSFVVSPFFRFNRTAALITVYISNPITVAPIYWFNYKVGTLIFEGHAAYDVFARAVRFDSFAEWWQAIQVLFGEIGPPLIFGSLVVAIVSSALTYPAMRWLMGDVGSGNRPAQSDPKQEPVASGVE